MCINPKDIPCSDLHKIANQTRLKIIEMSHAAKSAHLGSCLSCVDILVSLYYRVLNIDPAKYRAADRDIFILSKGHAAMGLYAVLAKRGFFSEEFLNTYNIDGGLLPEHPPARGVPGVEAATGSLGHGLSLACGQALAFKMKEQKNKVFCLISDGEVNEGAIWEAAMFASANGLSNLTVFLDWNKWQATQRSDEVLNTTNHQDKWLSFGWDVECINGHDFKEIFCAVKNQSEKPKMIIADTVKGRGVSFMEDDNNWHYRIPTSEEVSAAKLELAI